MTSAEKLAEFQAAYYAGDTERANFLWGEFIDIVERENEAKAKKQFQEVNKRE